MEATLSFWPPEVLCNTTEFLSGTDIGRLWLCGDRVLCSKLKFGGVTKFVAEMAGEFRSFWPGLASEFSHLRYFQAKSMLDIDEIGLEKYLAALSPTLRHFELKCYKLGLSWFTDRVSSSITNLTALILPLDMALTTSNHLRLPALLETLQCRVFHDSMLTELPHLHLTSLNVAISTVREKSCSLSRFTALKSLKIQGSYLHEPAISTLPPSLTTLEYSSCSVAGIDGIDTGFRFSPSLQTIITNKAISFAPNAFPPSLTHLEFQAFSNSDPIVEGIKNLPTTIRHFATTDSIKLEDLINLPASLTYLRCDVRANDLYGSVSAPTVDPLTQPRCPPNLTTFVSYDSGGLHLPILPHSLKRLEWGPWEIGPVTWPEKLETFKAAVFDRVTVWSDEQRLTKMDDMIAHRETHSPLLPPTVTELDLFFKTPTQLYLLLPSSLTYLRIDCGTSEQPIGPSTVQLSLFMEEEEELPQIEEVEERDIYERQFPSGWACLLPKTLKHLTLNVPHRSLDDQWVDDLDCPQLKSLAFLNPVGFSSSKVPSLPLSIEDIILKLRNDIDWNEIDLNNRKQLRVLYLSTQSKFMNWPAGNDALLQTIPPRLVSIALRDAPLSLEQKRFLTERHHIHATSFS